MPSSWPAPCIALPSSPLRCPRSPTLCTHQAICNSSEHPELKWVAGLYYFMSEVQPWNDGGWNYFARLRAFVDAGMPASDTAFIDGVSGIVNRGCAALSCAAGAVDGVDDRRANFRKVLTAMRLI